MGSNVLALDNILSASEHYLAHWSTGLESNKAGRLLRYLVCRLWDQGRGKLVKAQLDLAQSTIARKLNISRQWTGELVARLAAAGWIEYHSSKLPDGTNSRSVWRAGRLLKRLLVMLSKSRRGKKQIKQADNDRWHFSPTKVEKEISFILAKENEPPRPELIARIPMLKRWLERGKEKTEGKDDCCPSS